MPPPCWLIEAVLTKEAGPFHELVEQLSQTSPMCHTRRMSALSPHRYKNHRFPTEIISHGVWLYFRFCFSHRDIGELLFACGIIVSYEAMRKWRRKFGQPSAD
jgi:hypothetical protein